MWRRVKVLAVAGIVGWLLPWAAYARVELFVSPNGSDGNPGTLEKPLATPRGAREAIRSLKRGKGLPEGGVVVWFRGGTYYLPTALHLRSEDSGTAERPIVYSAYGEEDVTWSGGRPIIGEWSPHGGGVYKCFLRDVKEGRLNFGQMFVNGRRQILARYPNYDAENPLVGGGGYLNLARANGAEVQFDAGTFTKRRWSRPGEAVLHVFPQHYWGNLQYELKELLWDRKLAKLGRGGWQIAAEPQLSGASRFFIENVFEELDSAGEWYLSKSEGMLYYYPAAGVDLGKATVEAAVLKQVVEFLGSESEPVRHVTLRGMRIMHTGSVFLEGYESPMKGDWAFSRSGAVYMEGVADCAVEGCYFDGVGGNGVFVSGYGKGVRIWGNKFVGIGQSAVCLVGEKEAAVDGGNRRYPRGCVVSNNLIRECGVFGKQSAGVFMSVSAKNTVSHNVICEMPQAGICINDGTWGGHVIEQNDVHDTVRETRDRGGFTSWGRDRQEKRTARPGDRAVTVIRGNRFTERGRGGYGIVLESGSSDYVVEGNVCVGASIRLGEGDRRVVENNVFAAGRPPAFVGIVRGNSDRFVRNIVQSREGDAVYRFIAQVGWLKEMNHNVLHNEAGKLTVKEGWGGEKVYSLEDWRKVGNDADSVAADPEFVDAGKGDYRVKETSPALRLGFRNIDMAGVGLTRDFPERLRRD